MKKAFTPFFALFFGILAIFMLFRLVFFFFYYSQFSDIGAFHLVWGFLNGIRFDVSASVYLFLPVFVVVLLVAPFLKGRLLSWLTRFFYFIGAFLSSLATTIDLGFFGYSFRRSTADVFSVLGFGEDFRNTAGVMVLDYWYLLPFLAGFLFLFLWIWKFSGVSRCFQRHLEIPIWKYSAKAVIISSILVIAARGGIQRRPLDLMHASAQIPGLSQLILNTPFTWMVTTGKSGIEPKNYFSEEVALKYFSRERKVNHQSGYDTPNIFLIVLESISAEYTALGKGESYTPFLDSLSELGLHFNLALANGKRSIEGIPNILASFPGLMQDALLTSVYSGNKVYTIPMGLKEIGYQSAFFHGGTNGTLGFDHFTHSAGFDFYFGRTEFADDSQFDGTWGIFDEPFFLFAAKQTSRLNPPFFSCLFSISSHHPYKIPEKFAGKFPEGKLKIHQTVRYMDYSLRQFFHQAEKEPWFTNTVFLITADHTGPTLQKWSTLWLDKYRIPFILYDPKGRFHGESSKVVQHIDILPTVLDLAGYSKKFPGFGLSVLDSASVSFSVHLTDKGYQMVQNDRVLFFDGQNKFTAFDFKKDSLLERNLLIQKDSAAHEMVPVLKSFIQQFNKSVLENKLGRLDY